MGNDRESLVYSEALDLLDGQRYEEAIAVLNRLVEKEAGGTAHALTGLAHFQLEAYDRAAEHYRLALERDPDNTDWRDMLAQSQANAAAEVDVQVPERRFFERGKLLAASWINFQNHDWIHHGELPLNEVHEIPLAEDDPARRKYRQTKMFIGKTQADPTRKPAGEQTPVTFINEVTHWWDGSQIYGSDQETVDGLLTNLLRSAETRKTVADINVRNAELGGVVGNPIDKHGQPYGLTEEFAEVYRLHSLLPETIRIRRLDGGTLEEVPFVQTRQAGSARLSARVPMADLFHSFGTQHPGQLVLNNYPTFMRELSIPGNPLFDMGAVDLLRARERGVPRYNEFRRQLGLNPIRAFADLTDDEEQVRKLEQAYGGVEQLDLMIGTLAEGHRPDGFGFGETMFQIFILNATRRLQADRFYTDGYNERTYTREGLEWVDKADLKTVILRHYPELAGTGLGNIKNAFEPWDTGERLAPERHPLRAFDRDLRPDPWRGDA